MNRLLCLSIGTALGLVLLITGCRSAKVVVPYVAQVQTIQPEVSGLIIQATSGGGGELEITNKTGQDIYLIDAQGQEYVRITPTEVFEKSSGGWTKTRDSNVYYCHDPRITVLSADPSTSPGSVVRHWTIRGRAGAQEFSVSGQTIFSP